MTSTRTPVRHPDKDAAKISPASAAKRLPSAGCTTPVAPKRSVKNVVEKNGSRKTSPSPSPRLGRVEIVKERAKTDIDKENTPSAPPTKLPDDDDDMVTDMHTVFTAPEAPEQPIITPPPLDDDLASEDSLAARESTDTMTAATRTPELTLTESSLAS